MMFSTRRSFTKFLKDSFNYQHISKIHQLNELKLVEYGNTDTSLKLESRSLSEKDLEKLLDEDDTVFVKLVAAPINPADINIIQGKYAFLPTKLPAQIGNEGLFEVVKTSLNNKNFRAGDWVLSSQLGFGSWRSHALGKSDSFIKIPNNLDKHALSTLSVNPSTAYRMLVDFTQLKENDTVIQNGANSAVGQSVIQLGKLMKINVVNIVRKRESNEKQNELNDYLRELGAKFIFTEEDLRKSNLTTDLWKQIPKPRLAFNCVGGKATSDLVRLLDKNSILVTYGGMSRQPLTFNTADFIFKNLKCVGFWLTSWREKNPEKFIETIEYLTSLVQSKQFKAPKCIEFALSNYKDALKMAQTPFHNSKVLFVN